jgi:hypothetical protein
MLHRIALACCCLALLAVAAPVSAADGEDAAAGLCRVLTFPPDEGAAPAPSPLLCTCWMTHDNARCSVTPEGTSYICGGSCFLNGQNVGECRWGFATSADGFNTGVAAPAAQ